MFVRAKLWFIFPRCPLSFAERKDKTSIFQLPAETVGEAMLREFLRQARQRSTCGEKDDVKAVLVAVIHRRWWFRGCGEEEESPTRETEKEEERRMRSRAPSCRHDIRGVTRGCE